MEGKLRGPSGLMPSRQARMTPKDRAESGLDRETDSDRLRHRLIKQLFSAITSTGRRLHLVSYCSRLKSNSPKLPRPTTDPQLRHIVPPCAMYLDCTGYDSPRPTVTKAYTEPLPPPATPSLSPPWLYQSLSHLGSEYVSQYQSHGQYLHHSSPPTLASYGLPLQMLNDRASTPLSNSPLLPHPSPPKHMT
jgi:hypothetical protein